jgi:hypothetical protein
LLRPRKPKYDHREKYKRARANNRELLPSAHIPSNNAVRQIVLVSTFAAESAILPSAEGKSDL